MAWLFLAAFLGVTGTMAVIAVIVAVQRFRERRTKSAASRGLWPPHP
jgi:hypothetical protein